MNYKKAKALLGDKTDYQLRKLLKMYMVLPELNTDSENEKLRAVKVLLGSAK